MGVVVKANASESQKGQESRGWVRELGDAPSRWSLGKEVSRHYAAGFGLLGETYLVCDGSHGTDVSDGDISGVAH